MGWTEIKDEDEREREDSRQTAEKKKRRRRDETCDEVADLRRSVDTATAPTHEKRREDRESRHDNQR